MTVGFTLTPFFTVSTSAVAVVGGGSAHAALDAAGGSYLEFQNLSGTVGSSAMFEMDDVEIPAGARVTYLRAFLSAARVTGNTSLRITLFQPTPGNAGSFGYEAVAVTGATVTPILGAQQPVGYIQAIPVGQSRYWTEADINSLRLALDKQPDGVLAHVDVAWLTGAYAVQPVVAVTAPSATVTDTSKPTVQWDWTPDFSFPVQERYEVKAFTSDQFSAPGFSPDTSEAFWDSGEVLSSANFAQVAEHLDNLTTYRFYVRAAANVNATPHWSDWDYVEADIAFTPPGVPEIVSFPDHANARIQIDLTATAGATTDWYIVERSTDAGATWVRVRDGDQLVNTGTPTTLFDYELGNSEAAIYRAQAVSDDAGVEIASAWTSTVETGWTHDDWWWKDPYDPAANTTVNFYVNGIPELLRRIPQGRFDVPGRRYPVVRSDTRHGVEGEATLVTLDVAERAAVDRLLDAHITLLQAPPSAGFGSRYVVAADHHEVRVGPTYAEPSRLERFGFVEVERPAGDTVG